MDIKRKISDALESAAAFNALVYTDITEAIRELNGRWNDPELERKIDGLLGESIPSQFRGGFRAVLFRHLATPNYEMRRFMAVPDATGLKPLFLEIHEDKYSLNNPLKYYLGRMALHNGIGKKGGHKIEYRNVIDFNESHTKRISEVKTLWGESLIDFHHRLLAHAYSLDEGCLCNVSELLDPGSRSAKEYYRKLLPLFARHGILFENFMLNGEELAFTRDIFLPAFFEVWEKTGKKPLVVALEPTEIEGDIFWLCHPYATEAHLRLPQERVMKAPPPYLAA